MSNISSNITIIFCVKNERLAILKINFSSIYPIGFLLMLLWKFRFQTEFPLILTYKFSILNKSIGHDTFSFVSTSYRTGFLTVLVLIIAFVIRSWKTFLIPNHKITIRIMSLAFDQTDIKLLSTLAFCDFCIIFQWKTG